MSATASEAPSSSALTLSSSPSTSSSSPPSTSSSSPPSTSSSSPPSTSPPAPAVKIFSIVTQNYDNLFKINTYMEGESDDLSGKKVLLFAAKHFIMYEQGVRRSEEPIRTFQELEETKAKLEDGLYLTYPSITGTSMDKSDADNSIDVCKISSSSVYGWGSSIMGPSIVKTVNKLKRFSIGDRTNMTEYKSPAAAEEKSSSTIGEKLPSTSTIEEKLPSTSTIEEKLPSTSTIGEKEDKKILSDIVVLDSNGAETTSTTRSILITPLPNSPRSLNFEKVRKELTLFLKKREVKE